MMSSEDSLIGKGKLNSGAKQSKLLAVLRFMATVATWSGSYRRIKAWIPKHQSMLLKSTAQIQHINGMPIDWKEHMDKVHQLFSRVPHFNKVRLDFN
nr:tubby-like protein 8 [Ipomoea batatas]